MEYSILKKDNGVKLTMSGQFTFSDNLKFKEIVELTHQNGLQFMELDFAGIDFIDSAGLGMLLLLRDSCQNKNLPVSILSAQGQVEKIFMISKFDQLFSMRK